MKYTKQDIIRMADEDHSREKLQELSVTFIVQTEHLSKETQDTYCGKRLRVQQRWAIPLM